MTLRKHSLQKHQLYDYQGWLIAALIAAAALGPYLLPVHIGGYNLFGFRMLFLLSLVAFPFLSTNFSWWKISVARYYIIMSAIWLIYGNLGLLWTPDKIAGVRELTSISMGFLVGVIFLSLLSVSRDRIRFVAWGWVVAVLLTDGVVIWEISTGGRLASTYIAHFTSTRAPSLISTFDNPNNFAAFLVMATPFLWLALWYMHHARWRRLLIIALLLTSPLLLAQTSSVFSLLAFLLQWSVMVLFWATDRRRNRFALRLALVMLIVLTLYHLAPTNTGFVLRKSIVSTITSVNYSETKSNNTVNEDIENNTTSEARRGVSSGTLRLHLYLNALWLTRQTKGRGVGPGGFEYYIQHKRAPYFTGLSDTSYLINPHSFWLEVLSQYGILVFGMIALWFVWLLWLTLRTRHQFESAVLAGSLAGFVFAAFANSHHLELQIYWVFFASVLVLGTYLAFYHSTEVEENAI